MVTVLAAVLSQVYVNIGRTFQKELGHLVAA